MLEDIAADLNRQVELFSAQCPANEATVDAIKSVTRPIVADIVNLISRVCEEVWLPAASQMPLGLAV